jgi:hypothetical protein
MRPSLAHLETVLGSTPSASATSEGVMISCMVHTYGLAWLITALNASALLVASSGVEQAVDVRTLEAVPPARSLQAADAVQGYPADHGLRIDAERVRDFLGGHDLLQSAKLDRICAR